MDSDLQRGFTSWPSTARSVEWQPAQPEDMVRAPATTVALAIIHQVLAKVLAPPVVVVNIKEAGPRRRATVAMRGSIKDPQVKPDVSGVLLDSIKMVPTRQDASTVAQAGVSQAHTKPGAEAASTAIPGNTKDQAASLRVGTVELDSIKVLQARPDA